MKKALLALPKLVMETLEHQGLSDTHSHMELGTKEFTELGGAGGGLGWGRYLGGVSCSHPAILEWIPVAVPRRAKEKEESGVRT